MMNTYFTQTQNEELISEGLRSIPGVNFVGFINHHGRLENPAFNSKIPLTEDKKEMFCMSIVLHHKMQNNFDEDFEPIKYNIAARGNFKFVTIPVLSKILFVIMKRDLDHLEIINKITSFFKSDYIEKNDNNPTRAEL